MAKGATKPTPKVEKNIAYRGKPVVVPVDGKIAYDAEVWQLQADGDYINTLTGEVRGEDGFDWNGGASSDKESGGSDWDEFGQDAGGDFGGAQFKQGNGKGKK